ncbi:phage late control D family protein [Campylobacter hyointestinalis]|uniref:phage late control D family protein n=1 Tax=Campylobacter hyointestinalis TaxID=198 RepID=UPI000724FCF1|nr:phage tail protein [Campylobacter hyointestinalis]PPB63082.1 phage tail protein [Campylobacter hyointestinalis subsp. hyointestinalis]PPB65352.1 phage tail protein [Campylobacter hyointestinalis subsp. hyointestinalis]CUU72394.1 tail protein D [Campylobacter hyointestinalis subsp. hyointestinalis]
MAIAQFRKPIIKILYNGVDKTSSMDWISINIEDNEGDEADKCNIKLRWSNAKPRFKDDITVYADGYFLGSFKISTIKYDYKKSFDIEAISADFMSGFKTKKNRTFANQSYKDIILSLAAENGYKTKIDFKRSVEVVTLEQHDKSDVAFIQKIATDLDLSFSVKNQTLILIDKNKDSNRIGYDLNADDCISLSYEQSEITNYSSCEVTFRDSKTGLDEVVKAGSGTPVLKLVSMQEDRNEALKLAQSKLQKQDNANLKGNLSIIGRPYFAGAFLNLAMEDGAKKFIIKKVTHKIDKAWISDIEFF